MKNLTIVLLVALLSSCASNNSVVQAGLFQKRKYKKGYHLSFKKKIENDKKEKLESVQAKKVFKRKKQKEVSEFVVVNKVELTEKKARQIEEPLVSSLEMSDYSVKSILDKAILLSDSIPDPVENIDSDEKVYVKKWDIGLLLGGGVGAVFLGLLFGLFGATGGASVLFLIGGVFVVLGIAAFIYGLVLIDKRFVVPKRKVAKAKELEEKQKRDKEIEVRNTEELKENEAKLENGEITEKEAKRIEIRNKKWYLARILSYVFSTLTLVIPIFVIPAAVYTIMVMNIERKNEKNWVRISAVFRLVFLLLFTVIGITVAANILNSLGVVTL